MKWLTQLKTFFLKKILRRNKPFIPKCIYCKIQSRLAESYFDTATHGIICKSCVDKIYGESARKRLVPLAPEGESLKLRIE